MASSEGRASSATNAQPTKSTTPVASPAVSREPSPSRPSAPAQSNDFNTKPNNGNSNMSRFNGSTQPASATTGKCPRPLALNDTAAKLLNLAPGEPATGATSTTTNTSTANGSSSTMRWPTSPRIRSPQSTSSSRRGSAASSSTKHPEPDNQDPDATPQAPPRSVSAPSDQPAKSPIVSPIMLPQTGSAKVPRGFASLTSTLETVQEGDNSSPNDIHAFPPNRPKPPEKQPSAITTSSTADGTTDVTDSETDAASTTRSQETLKNDIQSAMLLPKKGGASNQSAPPAKARVSGDGSSKNMIVETETVASIPQSAAPSASTDRTISGKKDDIGPLGPRPSREMLKPKREKKKAVQKRPGLVTSQASSKADLFEARVASAAEEDDSDSDETFVYESNAPEPKARQPRHHSRTPSANSSHSTADRRLPPPRMMDGQRSVRQKRSMKFASSSQAADDDYGERDTGTVRTHRNNNNDNNHHNNSNNNNNHSQNGKRLSTQPQQSQQMHGFPGPHQTTTENESPFSQASRMRKAASAPGSRHSSNPDTPRSGSPPPYSKTPTKKGSTSIFDFGNDVSYSERDPLLGSTHHTRYRPLRMPSRHYSEYYSDHRKRRRTLKTYCGCCCVCAIMALVLVIAAGFLFATTHPLQHVSIVEIKNVLATEESLMADLTCTATNPNIVPISISDMDVNIFAKSRHVGPDASRHSHHQRHGSRSRNNNNNMMHALDSVDDGTDPITDPQTMLLGRIFHFDSALAYDASPWQKIAHNSTGGLRVDKPGNSTEEDGSERWEKVIQYPFTLIVRGVFKYTLPLSSRVVTASVSRSVEVEPGDDGGGDDDGGGGGGDGDGDGDDDGGGDGGNGDDDDSSARLAHGRTLLSRVYRGRMLGVMDMP